MLRFCLAQGLGHIDAAEATQETLLRAYRKRRAWSAGGNARNWILGFAMNVARECRRRRGRENPGLDATLLDGPVGQEAAAYGPEELAELGRAMEALPARQREAVACRYLRQLNVRDTAEAMGCAEGTVKAACAAGLAKLRQILKVKQ